MITKQQLIGRVMDSSTLFQKYQEDIDDTIANNNQCMGVIADITSLDGETIERARSVVSQLDLPIRVGYSDESGENKYYYITRNSSGDPEISTYNENTNQFEYLSSIYRVEEGHVELWFEEDVLEDNLRPTIYGLQYSVSDALGQATILSKLADLIRSGSSHILTDFTSLCANTMNDATYGTKTMYTAICDNLSKTNSSFQNVFSVFKSIYDSLSGMVANGNTFTFDKTDYRIQGYAFSNIVDALGQTVSMIVAGIVAIASPIAGFAVLAVSTIFGKIQEGYNTIAEQSHAQINFETANNLFNVPLWQGYITKRSIYRNDTGNINTSITKTGCACMTLPGLTIYLWEHDQYNYAAQAYINATLSGAWANVAKDQTFSGYQGTSNITDNNNGCNAISNVLSTYVDSEFGSRWYIEEAISNDHADEYNPENLAFICVVSALNFIFRICATYNKGSNFSFVSATDDFWKRVNDKIKVLNEDPNHAMDWEYLVNEIIYKEFRNLSGDDFENYFMFPFAINRPTAFYFIDYVDGNGPHYQLGDIPHDLVTYTGCMPVMSDFFISAPRFSSRASFNTIALAVAAIAATIAVIATAAIVKVKIRNSQIKSYAKVAAAQQNLQANPTSQDALNAYNKAIMGYNIKSTLFGYSSKLNMIDGWQEAKGKGNKSDVSIGGIYSTVKDIATVHSQNVNTQNKVDDMRLVVNNAETYSSNAYSAAASADYRLQQMTPQIEWIPIMASGVSNVQDDTTAIKLQLSAINAKVDSAIQKIEAVAGLIKPTSN